MTRLGEDLAASIVLTLELANQRGGYLTQPSKTTDELVELGMVTAKDAGDGFIIVTRLYERPPFIRARNGRWIRREQWGKACGHGPSSSMNGTLS